MLTMATPEDSSGTSCENRTLLLAMLSVTGSVCVDVAEIADMTNRSKRPAVRHVVRIVVQTGCGAVRCRVAVDVNVNAVIARRNARHCALHGERRTGLLHGEAACVAPVEPRFNNTTHKTGGKTTETDRRQWSRCLERDCTSRAGTARRQTGCRPTSKNQQSLRCQSSSCQLEIRPTPLHRC